MHSLKPATSTPPPLHWTLINNCKHLQQTQQPAALQHCSDHGNSAELSNYLLLALWVQFTALNHSIIAHVMIISESVFVKYFDKVRWSTRHTCRQRCRLIAAQVLVLGHSCSALLITLVTTGGGGREDWSRVIESLLWRLLHNGHRAIISR